MSRIFFSFEEEGIAITKNFPFCRYIIKVKSTQETLRAKIINISKALPESMLYL